MQQYVEMRRVLARAGFCFDPQSNRYYHTRDASVIRTYLDSDAVKQLKKRKSMDAYGIFGLDEPLLLAPKVVLKKTEGIDSSKVLEYIKARFANNSFTVYDLVSIEARREIKSAKLGRLMRNGDIIRIKDGVGAYPAVYALPGVGAFAHQ